jgi:hypothetical protein
MTYRSSCDSWALGALVKAGAVLSCLVGQTSCGGGTDMVDPGGNPGDQLNDVLLQSPNLQVDLPGRVTAFLQVVDGTGEPVPDLVGADFVLYENDAPVSLFESGQRTLSNPQSFRSYSHLVIDRSGSVTGPQSSAATIQQGARSYVRTLFGSELVPGTTPPQYTPFDPARLDTTAIKISWFDGSPEIYSIAGYDIGFSNDPEALFEAIDHLFDEPPFNASTNLYGAVLEGLEDLDEIDVAAAGEGIQNRTLTLVTFTDGTHRAGGNITLQMVSDAVLTEVAGRRKYSAFSIGVGAEVEPNVLQAIGPEGDSVSTDPGDLAAKFEEAILRVARLANSFYVLSYRSPKSSGTHRLTITANAERRETDPTREFDATGFGAGAAFLSLRAHPELAGALGGFEFQDAVEDAEGNVIACGWRGTDCTEPGCMGQAQAIAVRFLANGSVDTSWGGSGVLELEPLQSPSGATCVGLEPNGTILVGGWLRSALTGGTALGRLWKIDPTSGVSFGVSIPALGAGDEVIHDLVVESAGGNTRVVHSGRVTLAGAPLAALWAHRTADVQAAPAPLPVPLWTYVDQASGAEASREARALAFHGTGGIVAVGDGRSFVPSSVNGGRDVLVTRHFLATGALDPAFGAGGRVIATQVCATPAPASTAVFPGRAEDVRVDSQGRIVVAGTVYSTSGTTPSQQPAAWRFLSTGAPDAAGFFGSANTPFYRSGVVTLRLGTTANNSVDFGRDARVRSLILGPGDQVVLGGHRNNANTPSDRDMALISFAASGVPDTYNYVGFAIDDGAIADDSDDRGHVVLMHSSQQLWCLGVSSEELAPGAQGVPIVWIDEETERLFGAPE